jgi:hypothetical protein
MAVQRAKLAGKLSLYESPCLNKGPMRLVKFIDPGTAVDVFRCYSIAIYECSLSNGVHAK